MHGLQHVTLMCPSDAVRAAVLQEPGGEEGLQSCIWHSWMNMPFLFEKPWKE